MSRREFLVKAAKASASVACCSAAWGSLGNNIAYAASPQGTGKTLILVNFFGGIDGLSLFVPFNNQVYYDRRPNIAIPANQVLNVGSGLGLHPSWQALHSSVFFEGRLATVQQVGYPDANQSHFESQDIWSMGRRQLNTRDPRGWLGRLADTYFDSNYDIFGMGVSSRSDFLTNSATARPIVVNNLQEFGISWDWYSGKDGELRQEIATLNAYTEANASPLRGLVKGSLKTIYQVADQLREIDNQFEPAVTYPGNGLGSNLSQIAKLIRSNMGSQIFYTGVGGWDTHSDQADSIAGSLGGVSAAVDAFVRDIKIAGKWNDVCLVFFSEFGRNCFENGSGGTDHGHGNSMVLIGGNVAGGVYGPVPSASDLNKEYLDYYVDYRAVFKSVVRDHLGLDPAPVFDEQIPMNDANLRLFT